MIKVTITKIDSVTKQEAKNFLISETPTGVKKRNYDNQEEVTYEKKYEVRNVNVTERTETTLLNQEIADDNAFNLTKVIQAINNIPAVTE